MVIGDRLTVFPVAPRSGGRWIVQCPCLPPGWSCELVHRATTELLLNQPLTGWILESDAQRRHVEVSDSNFGFLPISDRMRPRYVASLRRLVAILERGAAIRNGDADAVSEVKGMFSRCARRDQWDWRAVHLALEEPGRDAARTLATRLGEIGAALRAGDSATAVSSLKQLWSGNLAHLLGRAAQTIEDSAPRIAKARPLPGQRPVGSEDKVRAPVRSVLSVYSKTKLDSANATHAELLVLLSDFLGSHGHRVETNQFVDAFTRLKSGPAIFEAKSITDENELSQVRHGLSQLFEYRYRHGINDASLWLLLSREPRERWLIDYLETDRGVHVLWLDSGELSGPSLRTLLESGSEALQRRGEV